MIVITRKVNEQIVINNDISIMVVEIRGDMVRLGIEAPREVPVHRGEVYHAIVQAAPRPPRDGAPPRPAPAVVELRAEHTVVLDRLVAQAVKELRRPITREQMLAAILDAVDELDVAWSQLESMDQLPPLLLSAAAQHARQR